MTEIGVVSGHYRQGQKSEAIVDAVVAVRVRKLERQQTVPSMAVERLAAGGSRVSGGRTCCASCAG